MGRICLVAWAVSVCSLASPEDDLAKKPGRLEIIVREAGRAVPARVHLRDQAGKVHVAAGQPAWDDHFVCAPGARLELPAGRYHYEIERGPETSSSAGEVAIQAGAASTLGVDLVRIADLASQGWWSGELHVHRPLEDVPLLMRAEDLHVAPVITWWNKTNLWTGKKRPEPLVVRFDGNRYHGVMGGEDEREGGALLYFGLDEPLPITDATREYPSPMRYLREARTRAGAQARGGRALHVDLEKPFWWDAPVWLASGQVDTLGLANNHMCRTRMYPDEAWGKPRDAGRLPEPRGNGYWTQEIYYHALDAGLRIPPSAGSASGVLPNPLGYNRVYVHLDGELTYDRWFAGLRAGRSFVTNGPLLRVRASGELPGHVFTSPGPVAIPLTGVLEGRDRVEWVEIIYNGRVERKVSAAELARTKSLGALNCTASGWFLVRAIAEEPRTFRFASTAPWYVEVGPVKRRVSRSSARFFLDWTEERMNRVKLQDPAQREEVLQPHRTARDYWSGLVKSANAD